MSELGKFVMPSLNLKALRSVMLQFVMLASLLVAQAQEQEISVEMLKSSSWADRLEREYVFSDDSIYLCDRSQCFWTEVNPYYLSSVSTDNFDDKMVGKARKGSYIVKRSWSDDPEGVYCDRIISCDSNNIYVVNTRDKYNIVVHLTRDRQMYDTLRLVCAYNDLVNKQTEVAQETYFKAFPGCWYDFERTFNATFFINDNVECEHQDLSHKAENFILQFRRLQNIALDDYCRRIVDVTIGLPMRSTPASDLWQEIVLDCITGNTETLLRTLSVKTELQQVRFWQFAFRENNGRNVLDAVKSAKRQVILCDKSQKRKIAGITYCKDAGEECAPEMRRKVKDVIKRTHLLYDMDRVYLSDSTAVYISSPGLVPKVKFAGSFAVCDSSAVDTGNAGMMKLVHGSVKNDRENSSGFFLSINSLNADDDVPKGILTRKQQSVITDTLLLAASYRAMQQQEYNRELEQFFFDAFPSSWGEFYAEMISDEWANRNFRSNASEYIDKYGSLTSVPVHDLLVKTINVTIGAIPDREISQKWRSVVQTIAKRHSKELKAVLRKYPRWQKESFLQFLK